MDTVNSFKGYGKVDEFEEAAFKRKTRNRIIILSISFIFLILLIIGAVAGVLVHSKNNSRSDEVRGTPTSPTEAIRAVCGFTLYPDSCFTSLNSVNSTDPEEIFQFSLKVAMVSLEKLSSTFPDEFSEKTEDPLVKAALNVCRAVLNDAVESLNDSLSSSHSNEKLFSVSRIDDLKTWLSTAITDQQTCFDALEDVNATFTNEAKLQMKNSTEFTSNSLAIVSKLFTILGEFKIPIHRRLLAAEKGFPSWITPADRRLLQESKPKPDITVAQDGSGDVTTITEAVEKIQNKSKTRFVIYVKAGEYVENVELKKSHWNVMIYGDGKSATIITGERSNGTGYPTFSTATFVATGKGFIARDMGFKNTAGPQNNQAVAFRSGSDHSVFYRCSFDSYQDTLYAHSNRQFYRECDITGTVDFIFGNSAAVFQKCNIMPRQPLPNQVVTITAQGKTDPNQNAGISIQRCTMRPFDDLNATTFLGRPWKNFSTTVVMQTSIGEFLHPLGWTPWLVSDPPPTIFYGEYENVGPGSNTSDRVQWVGYKPILTAAQASKFYVESFIHGSSWLPSTNVAFDST